MLRRESGDDARHFSLPQDGGDSALETATLWLEEVGVHVHGEGWCSVPEEAGNILIADAVNYAAKTIDDRFYDLKPAIIVETAIRGADAVFLCIARKMIKETWSGASAILTQAQAGIMTLLAPLTFWWNNVRT
jgi:hypothetical protein